MKLIVVTLLAATVVLGDGATDNHSQQEVPEIILSPSSPQCNDHVFQFACEHKKWKRSGCEVYIIAIAIQHPGPKDPQKHGYVDLRKGSQFVYQGAVPQSKTEVLPITLSNQLTKPYTALYTFRVNPDYLEQSRFCYQVVRDDGFVEANCVIQLNDIVQEKTDPGTPEQIVLLDVQGLWGGRDLWISSSRKAICRFADKESGYDLKETRYYFTVSEKQMADLLSLIEKHNFFSIQIPERSPRMDEAHPCIYVKTTTRDCAIGKLAGDKHEDFDSIYKALRQIAESGKSGQVIYQGEYDSKWKPGNFPANRSIWDMAKPDR